MALKSETASPPDGMVEIIKHESGGEAEDLEDGEIFDDDDDTPMPVPTATTATTAVTSTVPVVSGVQIKDDKIKNTPLRKGIPNRQRRKRPREDDRIFRNNKQRRKSEDGEKSKEKGEMDDDEMQEMSPGPMRSGSQEWDRLKGFDDMDEDEDDMGRGRGRNFNNRNRRGRNGRGGRRGYGMGRRGENICKFYLQGKCQRGSECPYSHANQRKFELCKFYMNDCCAKKDRCLFLHSEFPCRYYHMGLKCYAGKKCKFSHAKISSQLRANLLRDSKECEFLQHLDSPPPKDEQGVKPKKDKERGGHERDHRDRDHRDNKDKKKGKHKERRRSKQEERDRFTLHFQVDPRTISDEEDGGNRTPMPSPPGQSSDRGSLSPENCKDKFEAFRVPSPTPLPDPKDSGIGDELPDLPPDLPKNQRELYKRIQQQQREATNIESEEELTKEEKEPDDYKEDDWYSSEEEDGAGLKMATPIISLLNHLKQQQNRLPSPPKQTVQPAAPIIIPTILPDIDVTAVSKLLSTVRETIQQKQQSESLSKAALQSSGSALPSQPTPSTTPPLIQPGLNSLPTLASLLGDSAPPEKRRMRDPRLRGNSTEDDVDLRLGQRSGDVDLRQLPFKPAPNQPPANEIDASINCHPPVPFRLIPFSPPPPPDYSYIHSKNVNDPRLKKNAPVMSTGLLPTPAMAQPSVPRPLLEASRDPRQRGLLANDPRRKSSLLLHRDSDLRQPPAPLNHVNDVDLRFHVTTPHVPFK